MFYSELVFWARYRPGEDQLIGWLYTWSAYSFLAYIFLWVVNRFKIARLPALFLVGSLYGWLAEGVLVQTMYDAFPLQVSWTGLAWHALISVCLGWCLVRQYLHLPHPGISSKKLTGIASGLGFFWGFWAIFWQLETPDQVTRPLDFALFVWVSSLAVLLAYWVADRSSGLEGFKPPNWITILLGMLLLGYFVIVTVPANPLSLVILPPLFLIIFLAMRNNRITETDPSLDVTLSGALPVLRYLPLLAMPLSASLVYSLAAALDLVFPTNWIVYAFLTPTGFVLFILSLIIIFRRRPASLTTSDQ
jgi:hypothetical protein